MKDEDKEQTWDEREKDDKEGLDENDGKNGEEDGVEKEDEREGHRGGR